MCRRPLDDRDFRFEGGSTAVASDRWGRDVAHAPYSAETQDRLPPGDRLNAGGGYADSGPPFSGYAGGDRYDRYAAESERYAGDNVAPYEAASGRDYYDERVSGPSAAAARKYPPEDDFQTLRQRYDEEYWERDSVTEYIVYSLVYTHQHTHTHTSHIQDIVSAYKDIV